MNFIIFVGDLKSLKIWQNQIENKVKVKKKEFKGDPEHIILVLSNDYFNSEKQQQQLSLSLLLGRCWGMGKVLTVYNRVIVVNLLRI